MLKILTSNDIFVTKLITVNDRYVILTGSDSDLDNIFNNVTNLNLEKKGYYPQNPPELKVKRSIIIFNADQHIYNNKEDIIKEEIMALD